MKQQKNRLQGIISISSKGTGYVQVGQEKKHGQDPEIDARHLNTALHGDTVEIILHPKGRYRQTGEVTKIIARAKLRFAGVLEEERKEFFLKPDDSKMYTDILIPKVWLHGAKVGKKVIVEITSWTDPKKLPEGKVIKVLGQPGENEAEIGAIALERGFDEEFPVKVEEEAKKISAKGGPASGWKDRRDFRDVLTFTIDPVDAKDFDDAISVREVGPPAGGWEVGIHIADVSHYVRVGSELDREARERATSVYMVDRTIPMLPEALSNDLCSLVPKKDRLCMSAVFVLDREARVKSEWYGRTVIHSQKRFTYEEAEIAIKNKNAYLHPELMLLNSLAKKLTRERFRKGAISLDQEEVKFVLDKNGVPLRVVKKERGDSNKLIEEFMLLANRKVAEKLQHAFPIYRVHDKPSKEKMADLAFFLGTLGHNVRLERGIIPNREINKILDHLGEASDTVHRAVVRSMAKAIYSTRNIGHYGLAFEHYTHFTSPIRRYPDIVVHRLLAQHLAGKKMGQQNLSGYEKISLNSSEQEKKAADAERASVKYKQAEYMGKRIGKIFEGIVSGITEWGMYVEEIETKSEGLIRVRDLGEDYYVFNEKKMELVGEKTKNKFRFGNKVKIKVNKVDLARKTIDYVLA